MLFKSMRVMAALALAVLSLVVVACGEDDAGGQAATQGGQSATQAGETTGQATQAATEVAEVPFTDSPESGLPTSYPDPKPEDLTIGLLNPRGASEILANTFDSAKAEIKRLGGKAVELDAEQNPDRQITQFEQLVNQKVDAIVAYPIAEPKLLRPVLEKAAKANIPVVGIDLTPGEAIEVPGFATQLWRGHDKGSYLQVKAAAEALGPGAKLGEIGFAIPVPLFEYTEARRHHWADKFGLEIVDTVDSPEDTIDSAQEVAAGLLAGNPDIDGVLGYVEEAAIGAYLAARDAGRNDLKTFGRNGTSVGVAGIDSGRLAATVHHDSARTGTEAVKAAYDAAQGTEIPPVVVVDDPFIVTADNLDEIK